MPAASVLVRAKTARPRSARWPRLCLTSFVLAAITGLILWAAVTALLRQGQLQTVLSAGWGQLAAPLLVALVVATGICERIWPAEPRPLLARGHVQDALYLALHAIVVIGYARFPARGDGLTRTGLAGRPVPVEQDDPARRAPALVARQLIEPFQAQR